MNFQPEPWVRSYPDRRSWPDRISGPGCGNITLGYLLCSTSLSGRSIRPRPSVRIWFNSMSEDFWFRLLFEHFKESVFRLPIEAFSMFSYMGTLKHNGKLLASIGDFQNVLKNLLYRPDRDSDSLNLSLGSERDFK